MKVIYGEPIIQNFLKYSHYDFNTFKIFYEKLYFAHQAVEKETDTVIMLNEPITANVEYHQLELSKAFWRSVQRYKANQIEKDFNNYLFGVFKSTLKEIAGDIKREHKMYERKRKQEKDTVNPIYEDVSIINWLEEI